MKLLVFLSLIPTLLLSQINLKNCQFCHGINFNKKVYGYSRPINTLNNIEIYSTLMSYKYQMHEGKYSDMMYDIVNKYSDKELEIISDKISHLSRNFN